MRRLYIALAHSFGRKRRRDNREPDTVAVQADQPQAITGLSQCTLPSPSMRLLKHERRS